MEEGDSLRYISSASIDYLLSSFQTGRLRAWSEDDSCFEWNEIFMCRL